MTPQPFNAVGLWYEDFSQTTDEEVRALLERAEAGR
jgi:predicted phosphoribosyltransferase